MCIFNFRSSERAQDFPRFANVLVESKLLDVINREQFCVLHMPPAIGDCELRYELQEGFIIRVHVCPPYLGGRFLSIQFV
jgi:hypothetical protein